MHNKTVESSSENASTGVNSGQNPSEEKKTEVTELPDIKNMSSWTQSDVYRWMAQFEINPIYFRGALPTIIQRFHVDGANLLTIANKQRMNEILLGEDDFNKIEDSYPFLYQIRVARLHAGLITPEQFLTESQVSVDTGEKKSSDSKSDEKKELFSLLGDKTKLLTEFEAFYKKLGENLIDPITFELLSRNPKERCYPILGGTVYNKTTVERIIKDGTKLGGQTMRPVNLRTCPSDYDALIEASFTSYDLAAQMIKVLKTDISIMMQQLSRLSEEKKENKSPSMSST